MTSYRSLFLIMTVILFMSTAFADEKDAEVVALIERAKQLSDIRAEGAPPFQLKLTFKIIEENGASLEGAYTEVWVSKTHWRRETILGDFRRTQIVVDRKRWHLDSATAVPEHLEDSFRLTDIGRFRPEAWKGVKVEDRRLAGLSVRCLELKNGPYARSALCFDKTSGTLVADFIPSQPGTRIGETVCLYNDYQKFGDRLLARSYQCDQDERMKMEARVVELAAPATDQTVFTQPQGAKESVNCLSPIKAPTVVSQPDPKTLASLVRTLVVIRFIVGTDGKPHDLKVTSAPNRGFDEAALDAVRQWIFKPATCDGEPVEADVSVNIMFHESG